MGISVLPSIGFNQQVVQLNVAAVVILAVGGSFASGGRLRGYSRSGLACIRRNHVFDYGGLGRPNCLAPCTHGEVEAAVTRTWLTSSA